MDFKGRKISIQNKAVETVKWDYQDGLGLDRVHTGKNGGHQAINWAYLQGAKRLVLLGFDMHGTHWHGKHSRGLNNAHPFEQWIKAFDQLAGDLEQEQIEVINCTPNTRLTCFKKQDLRQTL